MLTHSNLADVFIRIQMKSCQEINKQEKHFSFSFEMSEETNSENTDRLVEKVAD